MIRNTLQSKLYAMHDSPSDQSVLSAIYPRMSDEVFSREMSSEVDERMSGVSTPVSASNQRSRSAVTSDVPLVLISSAI